jgi:hypothetical protein
MERLQQIQRKEAGKQDEEWSKSELRHCLQRHPKDNESGLRIVGSLSFLLSLSSDCQVQIVGAIRTRAGRLANGHSFHSGT